MQLSANFGTRTDRSLPQVHGVRCGGCGDPHPQAARPEFTLRLRALPSPRSTGQPGLDAHPHSVGHACRSDGLRDQRDLHTVAVASSRSPGEQPSLARAQTLHGTGSTIQRPNSDGWESWMSPVVHGGSCHPLALLVFNRVLGIVPAQQPLVRLAEPDPITHKTHLYFCWFVDIPP